MKRLFGVILVLLLAMASAFAASMSASADSPETYESEDGFTYFINDDGLSCTINRYTGEGGVIAIPSALDGYTVTSIDDGAFVWSSNLTGVVIPASVAYIGEGAFSSCSSLMYINVDDNNPAYCSIDGVLFDKNAGVLIQCPGGWEGTYTVPNSVTSIGPSAFSECSLTSVTIPSDVTDIDVYAFSGCGSLTAIVVDDNNPAYCSIDGVLFDKNVVTIIKCPEGREGIYSIPSGVTSIGDNAFSSCKGLTSVTIPDGVTSIGDSAFSVCEGMTSVTIPEGVISIGDSAFSSCINMESIVIPDSVKSIDEYAFYCCTHLESITIPIGVTSIGEATFYQCYWLGSATIPASVTSIGDMAFYSCTRMYNVYYGGTWSQWNRVSKGDMNTVLSNTTMHYMAPTSGPYTYSINQDGVSCTIAGYEGEGGNLAIPSNLDGYTVTVIDSTAFSFNTGLTSVTIPASVTGIVEGAFSGCDSLTSIEVDENNPAFCSAEGVLFDRNAFTLIQFPGGKGEPYSIPDSVTSFGYRAFSACQNLTSITIPGTVTVIDNWAFESCAALADVTILDGVTSIDGGAFCFCGLTSITIPASVTNIGDYTFYYCENLTDVYYGGSEEQWDAISIGADNDALANASIHYTEILPDPFSYDINDDGITCTITAYNGEGGDVIIPSALDGYTVTSIGDDAFASCESLTSVIIPNGVTSTGNYAFQSCWNLTSVTLPDSMTRIGMYAFNACESLTGISIPESVVTIDDGAFEGCDALTDLTIPGRVTSIGAWAFSLCGGLTDITIPASVVSIGEGAFATCGNLASVSILGDITSINDFTFDYCINLSSVTIPESVTMIGDGAFEACESLAGITIPAGVTDIGEGAFSECVLLTDVYFKGTEEQWNAISVQTGNDPLRSAMIHYNWAGGGMLILPEELTKIGTGAFTNLPEVNTVVIPASVTEIADGAFDPDITIKAPAGSYALIWAMNNGFSYIEN